MINLSLNLRQRKLLYLLQGKKKYTTGQTLAKELNVSPRTIRNDIVEINEALAGYHAAIQSERSKGYLFFAENEEEIRQLNRIDTAFLTKEDRIRYLAFLLCLAETPINLYDLEDEIYVSHTTLINDVNQLKKMYSRGFPHIHLISEKNEIYFEKDELKIRKLLLTLFHADWDYNTAGNAYYGYEFLDRTVVDFMMDTIPVVLQEHGIRMEDPALVALELMMSIVYHRSVTGHLLVNFHPSTQPDELSSQAAEHIFGAVEEHFQTWFPEDEKLFVKDFIQAFRLPKTPDPARLSEEALRRHDKDAYELCVKYIRRIHRVFSLDLSRDMDFLMTMELYFSALKRDGIIFNTQGNTDYAKEALSAELEIAWCIQPDIQEYLGRYLSETELLHLAQCISGAFEYQFATHPEMKLRAVVCSHTNMPATWAMKNKILSAFGNYIDIVDLQPVGAKSTYDFSDIDVALTTVSKQVDPKTDSLQVTSLLMPDDYLRISAYIRKKRMELLCRRSTTDCASLLEGAIWHTDCLCHDMLSVISLMNKDFTYSHLAADVYMLDILRRESISSFATRAGIVFIHSLLPADETRLSVTILRHRIVWKEYKVRIVITGLFKENDRNLIFRLKAMVGSTDIGFDTLSGCKTKEDVLSVLHIL